MTGLRVGRAAVVLALGGSSLLLALPAAAEHACRVKARELYAELYRQATGGTATEQSVENAVFGALGANPECEEELRAVVQWQLNRQQGLVAPFPFPEEDDPRHGFLGPVGAWWNIVRFDILQGSWLLWFLLGWELFILPFAIGFGILGSLFGSGRSRLSSA